MGLEAYGSCIALLRNPHSYDCSTFCSTFASSGTNWYQCCVTDNCNNLPIPSGVSSTTIMEQCYGGGTASECQSMSISDPSASLLCCLHSFFPSFLHSYLLLCLHSLFLCWFTVSQSKTSPVRVTKDSESEWQDITRIQIQINERSKKFSVLPDLIDKNQGWVTLSK